MDDGQENDNHPVIKLINSPNPLQSKKDFIKEYIFFKYAYGFVYQYPVQSSGFNKESIDIIYNLNPGKVQFHKDFATRLTSRQETLKELKERQFKYEEDQQTRSFNIGEVITFYDIANGLSNDFLYKAPSRLNSIQKQIKNISISGDAKYSALANAGRWIVTGENQGNLIQKGLGSSEKEEIEKRFSLFGFGSKRRKNVIASTAKDIKAHSLHTPMNQLGINESVNNDGAIIANAFGISRELISTDSRGATWENQQMAMANLIQNVVQVEADDFCNTYTNWFELDKPLTASFDHLPSMQYIEERKADKALKLSQVYRNVQDQGLADLIMEIAGIHGEAQ